MINAACAFEASAPEAVCFMQTEGKGMYLFFERMQLATGQTPGQSQKKGGKCDHRILCCGMWDLHES